ncbi:MAG: zinc-ribbon domain-containing protein [Oscillospiraceae bacterium]|nr:zinc-ribbon domain-containing protein [Oscillospiraceae bacterium]
MEPIKNLQTEYPEIAATWHPTMNGSLQPNQFAPRSNKYAWWLCPTCNGAWKAQISSRTRYRGCPYCSGRKVLEGFNDLASLRPDVLNEWDYDKNDISPTEVTQFSTRKVFWLCKYHHSYEMTIANKTSQNQGCPYCAGKKVLKGFNDLLSQQPDLCEEWDYDRNTIKPDEVTRASQRKVWWNCRHCGYQWEATINTRVSNGSGCIKCGNKRGAEKRIHQTVKKNGSLAMKFPELLKEWDYEKNTVSPEEITSSSHQKVWWICDKYHSFLMDPASRTRVGKEQGCPYCANKKILPGFNDLSTTHPLLAQRWDYDKNSPVTPREVFYGSQKGYWWICDDCGKSYKMSPNVRTRNSEYYCCNRCAKKRGSVKKVRTMTESGNTLLSLNPKLAAEWHPSRNGDLTSADVTISSGRKVWWVCPICKFEWQQTVHTRSKGEGCPNCAKSLQTSFPEQAVYYYIEKQFPDAINTYKADWLGAQSLDIFIPSINVAIEYDGAYWHQDAERDTRKTRIVLNKGITLIRIREKPLSFLDDGSFEIAVGDNYANGNRLVEPITQIFDFLVKKGLMQKSDLDVDIVRDKNDIYDNYDIDYPKQYSLF